MLPFLLGRHMKFEDYYKEFCEVFGHPLWMLPMMCIVFFVGIETLHFREHKNIEEMLMDIAANRNLSKN